LGRKRLAYKILERIEEEEEEGDYIVVYDFTKKHIPREFYKAIEDLRNEGYLILQYQKSVLYTNSKRCALALKELVEHYGDDYGAHVKVFRIAEEL